MGMSMTIPEALPFPFSFADGPALGGSFLLDLDSTSAIIARYSSEDRSAKAPGFTIAPLRGVFWR